MTITMSTCTKRQHYTSNPENVGSSNKSTSTRRREANPFRVLGIAMIVDQRGTGARLVARYPTQPPVPINKPSTSQRLAFDAATSWGDAGGTQIESSNTSSINAKSNMKEDDLFFSLTARQMAKLFRTKKSLCGQALTLNVEGTVFCCRAVLMQGEESTSSASVDDPADGVHGSETTIPEPTNKNQLELFSVVVALSSPTQTSSIPFSNWYDGATEDQLDLQRYIADISTTAGKEQQQTSSQKAGKVSSSFLSIRRVHISLARFCRVLEREERRCQYVSLQSNQFFSIRNERQKKWEEEKASSGLSPGGGGAGAKQGPAGGGGSTSTVGTNQPSSDHHHHRRGGRHMRSGSWSTVVLASADRAIGGGTGSGEDRTYHSSSSSAPMSSLQQRERELELEIMELMLAAPPPERDELDPSCGVSTGRTLRNQSQHHHGNLVRELVQVFHSLSRNDYDFPPTPAALLSERDGVVYVNQHIAIPIEAASRNSTQTSQRRTAGVRPYHTLLFPHASPSELLETFQSSGSFPPQHLNQLLLTVNPQKSLSDIAIDANLPLYMTMEIASYLVAHGVCVASPVVSRSSRLACFQIYRIPNLALEFSQTFPNVDLCRLVSFLTSSKTLGEVMSALIDLDSDEGAWLRESLVVPGSIIRTSSLTSLVMSPQQEDVMHLRTGEMVLSSSSKEPSPANPNMQSQQQQLQQSKQQQSQQPHRWVGELEEPLYAMAIWLLSHRVLNQLQEYFVVSNSDETYSTSVTTPAESGTNKSVNPNNYSATDAGENLFRELFESNYLVGNVSISALCWRLGFDQQKLRSWGLRHERVRIVSRIPASGDDWDSSMG